MEVQSGGTSQVLRAVESLPPIPDFAHILDNLEVETRSYAAVVKDQTLALLDNEREKSVIHLKSLQEAVAEQKRLMEVESPQLQQALTAMEGRIESTVNNAMSRTVSGPVSDHNFTQVLSDMEDRLRTYVDTARVSQASVLHEQELERAAQKARSLNLRVVGLAETEGEDTRQAVLNLFQDILRVSSPGIAQAARISKGESEIDTAIYGALSTRIKDRKAKFRAKEADEAGSSSEPPKQSSVETSGIRKSVKGARVLRLKYEEFSSQLFEKSEGVPDIFSDTENVNKFMFAAQLMWEVAGKHVVDNDVYNSQYSQQITQQTNGYDCGVHILYVITKLMEADKEGNLLEYFENGGLPDSWGTTKIVADFRLKVHELFTSLLESDTQ
ncbi:hypothetical protein R1sor_019849 [Riccia sorocarpa]|uniref:Ubiquitin-like protease family profile domain-containing protein n=1 Tax=Riccia sorocarpa TaxID=122646 RepID=A0ABD3IGE8_9MARC